MYLIDDGALNWVIAPSKHRALGIFWSETMTMGSYNAGELKIERLTEDRANKMNLLDYDGTVIRTMWEEYLRDQSPRYVGCSEF